MRLRFVSLDEDGASLVLTDADDEAAAGTIYTLPIDAGLRAALRPGATGGSGRRPGGAGLRERPPVTPRHVQALMRAGHTSEEIAEEIGWAVERVRRFESPILAEREFVSSTAQAAHVRGRVKDGVFPTLGTRVRQRLAVRGVSEAEVRWHAARPEGGTWTVSVYFSAGNKDRSASWSYDAVGRTVEALDDEARWLSEDEQILPAGPDGVLWPGEDHDDDLVSTIRQHNKARGRRSRRRSERDQAAPHVADHAGQDDEVGDLIDATVDTADADPDPAGLPGQDSEQRAAVLPLEDLRYDPDTMGPPPSAGRPESARTQRSRRGNRRDRAKAERPTHEDEVDDPQDVTLGDLFDDDPADDPAEDPADTSAADLEDDTGHDDIGHDEAGEADDAADVPSRRNNTDDTDHPEDGDQSEDRSEPEFTGPDLDDEAAETSADTSADAEPAPSKRKGRTSVPSWDDIMFGSRGKR